jgi:hypothetical protein
MMQKPVWSAHLKPSIDKTAEQKSEYEFATFVIRVASESKIHVTSLYFRALLDERSFLSGLKEGISATAGMSISDKCVCEAYIDHLMQPLVAIGWTLNNMW